MKKINLETTLLVILSLFISGNSMNVMSQEIVSLQDPSRIGQFNFDSFPTSPAETGTISHTISLSTVNACETTNIHQNGSMGPDDFLTHALSANEWPPVICAPFTPDLLGFARLFDLSESGIPATSGFIVESVSYVLVNNSGVRSGPTVPVTVGIVSYPAGTTVPSVTAGTVQASQTTTHPYFTYPPRLITQNIPAKVPAGDLVLVTLQGVSNNIFFPEGAIFGHDGGVFGGIPELAPTYAFGCPATFPMPDYTDMDDLLFTDGSILLALNGEADADCDGTGDSCDFCPGGDDDGPCDSGVLPPVSELPANYICSNNSSNTKIKVCHRDKTLCISEIDVQDHLNHGDFLGPCASCDVE